ncbi:Wzz/FepE/Etk N-terminal domain-containing protein [beta proteobacterium MWH-UniP1]
MKPDVQDFDDEISLFDLVEILRKRWLWIAGLALASAAVAFIACQFVPNQYQASTLIQIGRLGNIPFGSGSGSGSDVESPQTLAERANSSGFAQRLKSTVGNGASLQATAVKNTKLVKLDVRAATPEQARQVTEAVIRLLQEDHAVLAEPIERALSKAINQANRELGLVTQAIAQLNKQGQQTANGKADPLSYIIFNQAQQQLNDRRLELVAKVNQAEANLLEQSNFKTGPVTPIYASDSPVYPKTNLVTLVALLAGGFVGVLGVFVVNAYENRNKVNS